MAGHEGTIARFDRWAGDYDRGALQAILFEPVHAALLDRMLRLVPAPRRVLDVGCGTGRLLRSAAGRLPGRVLVGLDASAGMLSVAAGNPGGPRYVQGTASRLPLRDGGVDLVLCTFSYRHWAEQEAGLREMARVLARGGLLGFADVLPPPRRGRWWRPRRGPLDGLLDALERGGLAVASVERITGFGLLGEATLVLARR